jgi:predicted metal-dependent phosphoesterase TrpH
MMYFDLHVHSKYSFDSLMEVKTIIKVANKKNLNGLAITDHNTIIGGKNACEKNRSPPLIIIGSEVSTDVGDIIGLFLTDDIKYRDSLEVLDQIESQGGVSVFPHPFKGHRLTDDKTMEILRRVDCVEVLNSRAPITMKEYRYLKSLGKILVAGSDAHFPFEIGLCQTLINVCTDDLDQIKKYILSNKIFTIGTYGPPYFQPMSQMIKSIKLREARSLILRSLSLFRTFIK